MIYGKGCWYFCMEPHYFPNSINTKEFDAPVFDAGEVYQTSNHVSICHKGGLKWQSKKKSSAFAVVQQIGKSFFLPVSVLPIAGILLGLGSSFTNADTIAAYHLQGIMGEGTILNALLTIMSQVGNTIFGNLPLIFALAVALGMAKK